MKNILKITKLTAFFLFLMGGLISCKKEKNNMIEVCPSPVLGKWKLEFVYAGFQTPNVYYSQYDVVYEFKENNVLVVSGKVDVVDSRIHENGKYYYGVFVPKDTDPSLYTPLRKYSPHNPLIIKIDTVSYELDPGGTIWNGIRGLQIKNVVDNGNIRLIDYGLYFSKID